MTPLVNITDYVNDMQLWLNADILTYKNLFSPSLAYGLCDYTAAPGTPYSPSFQPQGYLSIPLAGSIIASMEFLGFCIKGNPAEFSATTSNINAFYSHLNAHGVLAGSQPTAVEIKRLIQSCRHGFAHKFFPKHQIAVGYYPASPLFILIPTGTVLNTGELIEHITKGLDHIIKNVALHAGMQACYDVYITAYE